MSFQQTVNIEQGLGVPGSIYSDAPLRAERLNIYSNGRANVYGYAFTKNSTTNIAQVGGEVSSELVFAGILVNTKEAVLYGTTAGTLEPTLAIPDQSQGDFVTMGDVIVKVTSGCKIGDFVLYDRETGALSTTSDRNDLKDKQLVPNAVIHAYPVTNNDGGLTVVRLTN